MQMPRLYILIALLIAGNLTAQEPTEFISYSTPISIPRSEELIKLILIGDSTPAVITQYGESVLLRTFDDETENTKPELIYSNIDRKLINFKIHRDGAVVLSKSEETDGKQYTLSNIAFTSDSLMRLEDIHFNLSKDKDQKNANSIFFRRSQSNAFTLVCQQEAFTKDRKAIVNLFAMSADTMMHFHLPVDFDADDVKLLGASIDERGVIYFAALTGIKLNSPFRKKYLVYAFDPYDKVLTEFDLSTNDFFIQDMVIATSDSGFFITALYSTDPLIEGKSNGYSFIQSTPDGRSIKKRLGGSFPQDMVLAHRGFDDDPDAFISDLFLVKTLSIGSSDYLVLEKRYHDQICNADPSTGIMTCTDQYHYNSVSFENPLNPDKSLTVAKRQLDYDRPSPYTSQVILVRDEKAWMFYNDHFRNEGLGADKIMNNASRSVMRFVSVNTQGQLQSGVLSRERQANYAFIPTAGMVQNDQHAFFLSKDGEFYRVGRFDFSKLSSLSEGYN